ncbi:MAG TPA: tripartite tricarboxylate transporter substrate-binding protein [Xanthobacteraceae bacterium]|nr:tripartite tricarboxylate transporter substrate-binding protein [Xanthobacteraceae bacterium]
MMRAVVLALLMILAAPVARAQVPFPAAPVRILVPFAAGGPTDVVARILAELLSAQWGGKSVLVENRPGAGTIVATAAVAKAPADGHTVLIGTNSLLINPAIDAKLPYDTFKDLAGVSMIATQPVALVANKAFPANTIPELVAESKRRAEPLNYTSPGPRGVGHLAGEMLKVRAGIDMIHINYNGSAPALTDVIAGRVPIMFDIWHSARRYVDSGDLKLIAGAGAGRLADTPQVPVIAETFPGFDVIAFNAMVAPAGVPRPVLQKLSDDVRAVVGSAEFAARTRHLGIFPGGNSPEELLAWMHNETARWAEIARAANIKAE